jgi:hypothetical protein
MDTDFQIAYTKQNGNLHIDTKGDFDGNSAWELVNLLAEQYNGTGQVVIDTHQLLEMCPFGCRMFRYQFKLCRVPAERVLFEGEKGYEIAPLNSRVVVRSPAHECRCTEKCANCACSARKPADTSSHA